MSVCKVCNLCQYEVPGRTEGMTGRVTEGVTGRVTEGVTGRVTEGVTGRVRRKLESRAHRQHAAFQVMMLANLKINVSCDVSAIS